MVWSRVQRGGCDIRGHDDRSLACTTRCDGRVVIKFFVKVRGQMAGGVGRDTGLWVGAMYGICYSTWREAAGGGGVGIGRDGDGDGKG